MKDYKVVCCNCEDLMITISVKADSKISAKLIAREALYKHHMELGVCYSDFWVEAVIELQCPILQSLYDEQSNVLITVATY